ncbi:MAG: asparagine synthase (glutamine-hydrolyzing) [archaeon]
MCGINGFNWSDKELINSMNQKILHRGPDFNDSMIFENLSLGHTRLSIIDLSEKGNQPMFNNNFYIVFNGEIYNFKELKEKYCQDYNFKSNTDTEVILAMYEKFGQDCVQHFNGMWAFCIYDKNKNILFCSRDRLGIKPFYYQKQGEKFIFSSEIKAILTHKLPTRINPSAISSFLRYRYVLEEDTFFTGIKKLKPGYSLTYDLTNNSLEINQYWDVHHKETLLSFNSQINEIEKGLIKSTEYRMLADVEVGSILSGGLDSSLLSAIMAKQSNKKINTYTVKFSEEGYDETPFAKKVADQYETLHNELEIKNEDYLSSMHEYLKYKDEPIGVPNEVALFLLFRQIKKTATVVLAGEGADEIFAGYGRIFRSPFDYMKEHNDDSNFLDFFMNNYGYFKDDNLKQILKPEYYKEFKETFSYYLEKCPRDYYNKISYLFLKVHLPGLLLRSDVSSMANAVEARVPFLDHNFVQQVYSLPFEHKNRFKNKESIKESLNLIFNEISENHDIPKFMLKRIAQTYIPEEIINRKKQGFPLPLNKWFGEDFIKKMKIVILNPNNCVSKYFNLDNLNSWIEQNKEDPMFGQRLWMIYSLEIWLSYIKENYNIN